MNPLRALFYFSPLWDARKSNQSILKEISPECSLEATELNWTGMQANEWPPFWTCWLLEQRERKDLEGPEFAFEYFDLG